MEILAEAGSHTVALFEKVKGASQTSEHARRDEWPAAELATEADRFKLWAINLGLFVRGHASLDYRVRDAESIRLVMLRLIASLNETLTEVLEYSNDPSITSLERDLGDSINENYEFDDLDESCASQDGSMSDMDLLVEGVRDPIDRLFKLAVWIRNPSSRVTSSKLFHYQLPDPETGVDLLHVFKEFDYDYVSSLFLEYRKSKALADHGTPESTSDHPSNDQSEQIWEPIQTVLSQYKHERSAGAESFLIHRIAWANTRRRRQFAYWKNHRDKLTRHTATAIQQVEGERHRNLETLLPTAAVQFPTNDTPNPVFAVTQSITSITTASRLNIPQLGSWNDQATNTSVSEYAASDWQPGKEKLGFPPSPKHLSKGKFFECPYCFTICSTALLSEKAWRAHLIHDMRPYVCTYEHCRHPDQLYDNIEDWIQHEESTHCRVTRCPEHSTVFPRLEDYKMHLESEHAGCSDDIRTALFMYGRESTSQSVTRCCPICLAIFTAIGELNSHIARHLERFSLFSLPRSAGEDADDVDQPGSNKPNRPWDTSRGGDTDETLNFTDTGESSQPPPHDAMAGTFPEAETMYQRALEGYEKAFGPDHPSTLDTINNLGRLYLKQGRLKEAEAMYQRALEGYEKALGPDHTSTLDTVHNLGILYSDQGRLNEAEMMYQRALEGKEKALGPDHTSTLDTINNLGNLYKTQGRLKEAEAMYERALEGYEKELGPDHPSTLDTVNSLGNLYSDQGRLKEAETMYQRALEGWEKALGPDHTSTLDTVHNLGILYSDQGRLKEAETMYQRALEGYEKALGPDHTSSLITVNNLGNLYEIQGRLKEAEMMYQRALEGKEKALGPDHPSTLDTINNLGNLYKTQGRLKEAEMMYQRALEGYEKAFGPDHTSTLGIVNNLGHLYVTQGRLKEAEMMYQRALEGWEKAIGPDNPSTLDIINNLGSLYSDQGRLKEAEMMYQRALEGKEKALGPDHPSTLDTINNLGNLYEIHGRLEEAEAMYQRALEGKEKALGPDHSSTRYS